MLHDNMVQLKRFTLKTLFNKEQLINYIERNHLINKKYKKVNTTFLSISKDTTSFIKKNIPSIIDVNALPNAINFQKFYSKVYPISNSKKLKPYKHWKFFTIKKNQLFLIDIAKELLKSSYDFEFNIFGEGSLKEMMETKVQNEQLNNHFVFHGNSHNITSHLKEADIYVHTAYYEPFGLVLLEAMAAGLPVVSLDGGGNKDFIENDVNGYIIKDQNPKLFSDQIIKLSNNKDLYTRISKKGQVTARGYDIKEYTKSLINIYQKSLTNI